MKIRKILSVALAVAMLSSIASVALAENAPSTLGMMDKYDPAINISFVRAVDDDTSTNILPKTPGETIESNRWLDLYSNDLGINVTYDWTVKGGMSDDAYKQKINVTLASGDLPDVSIVDATQLKQLVDAGMVADMTQYWNDYATPFTKECYSAENGAILDSATFDGKLMGIPQADNSAESTQYLWIRKDWLDKLGLSVPTTMQELIDVARAFTTQDPDGNGVDDTYGLAATKDLYSGCMALEGFFAGYHSYPNFWLNKDGKVVYGSVQPETKDALAALAEMYKDGMIDPEFGVKDGGKVAETIAAGKIGIDFGEQWNPMYPLISNYNNDPSANWIGYSLVSADDQKVMVPQKFRTSYYYAVRKDYPHPEALVKMISEHLEMNWGEHNNVGYYYMPKENGNVGVWKFSPVIPIPANKNLAVFNAIKAVRDGDGDMSKLTGESAVVESNVEAYANGDTSQWGWDKIYGLDGVFNVLNGYIDNGEILNEAFVGAPTQTMVERWSTLQTMEKEVFVKIIMGESTIDAFDKFVSDWNALGGEQITQEVNDWYANHQK